MKKKSFNSVVISLMALASVSYVSSCGEDKFDFDVHEYETVDETYPEGSAGDESIVGYYVNKEQWEYWKTYCSYACQFKLYRADADTLHEQWGWQEVPGGYVVDQYFEKNAFDYLRKPIEISFACLRIVDGHKLFCHKGYVVNWSNWSGNPVIIDEKEMERPYYYDWIDYFKGLDPSIEKWHLYFYVDTMTNRNSITYEGRYSIQEGSKMVVHTDLKEMYINEDYESNEKGVFVNYTYKNNQIFTEEGSVYEKIDIH